MNHSETELPVVPTDGVQVAALVEIVDSVPRSHIYFTLEIREKVVTIQVHLELFPVGREALSHLFFDVRDAGSGAQGWEPVEQRDDVVVDGARLYDAGPAHHHRDA